jgi:hypothetical protein
MAVDLHAAQVGIRITATTGIHPRPEYIGNPADFRSRA